MARRNGKIVNRSARTRPPSSQDAGALAKSGGRSLAVAQAGIKTGADFANFMSGLMSDVIEGKVPPQVGNAACNAGGKLLKIVELQYKYGSRTTTPDGHDDMLDRPLLLAAPAK